MLRARRPLLILALALAATPALSQEAPVSSSSAAAEQAHLDAMAREHAHHTPAASPATAPAPRQEVETREVTYGTAEGKPVRGFLARPRRGASTLPAVVMVHEWWGLNDNVKTMARRLAGEGYQVLAVDMYGGRVAATPEEARALSGEVMANTSARAVNLRSAAEFLRNRGAPKVGVLGWCFGGGWALQAGLFMPEQVDATVVYYGRPVTERDRLSNLDSPLLGLYGGRDQGIPVELVREMETALRDLGKSASIHVYENAAHAFANPSGQAYDAAAAQDAWTRTTAFLAQHLRSGAAATGTR